MITLTFPDGASARIRARHHRPRRSPRASRQIAGQAHRRHGARRRRRPTSPIRSRATPRIEFLTRDDPRALELIRHDCAHVLAEAVQALWPGTQVTIGPVIENGFYYDFARNEPFTPEDFPAIEAKMREIIARDQPFTKEVWSRDKAQGTSSPTRARPTRSSSSTRSRRTRTSRSTTRATGSTSAAART